MPAGPGAAGEIPCPRCAAPVGSDQDWCLACGDAARTRLVPTPNWHAPIAFVAVVAVLAGLALAIAFVTLTNDAEPPAPANSQAAPPAPDTGQPQATTTAAPPATTAAPPATAPVPPAGTATTRTGTGTGSTAPGG
jgi:hypothetical protein